LLTPERGVAAPKNSTEPTTEENTMRRTIEIIATVLAATAIGIVAYDRSRAHDDKPGLSAAAFQTASVAKTGGYRIEATPKTVLNLGWNRNGCTLTSAAPAQTVCDIALAFPDVGLAGTVTFVGSSDLSTTADGLTIDLGN
jgi:hypothetical protein